MSCGRKGIVACKESSKKEGITFADHINKYHPELLTKESQYRFQAMAHGISREEFERRIKIFEEIEVKQKNKQYGKSRTKKKGRNET